jgi:hypothetical protein
MNSLIAVTIYADALKRFEGVGRDRRWLRAEMWQLCRELGSHGESWSAELNEYLSSRFEDALLALRARCIQLEEYEWADAVQWAIRNKLNR